MHRIRTSGWEQRFFAETETLLLVVILKMLRIEPTNCAERTAVFKAVSEGIQEFDAIAIAGGLGLEPPREIAAPCGVCRQVLREFCEPETFLVLLGKGDGSWQEYTLEELLPLGFSGKNLEK